MQTSAAYAQTTDLDRITFTVSDSGASPLSPRARAYLRFLVALVRLGYKGLACPVNAITRAQLAAGGRYTSDRSTFAALAELEQAAYFHRSKYRVGDDRFRTVITFHLDAFTFWTQRSASNVRPLTVPNTYTKPQLQGLQEVALTSSSDRSYSCNITDLSHAKRAHAIDIDIPYRTKTDRPIHKWLPILYTLKVLLGSPKHPALTLAQTEIAEPDGPQRSGVDWSYWSPRWSELTIPAREAHATAAIVPLLRAAISRSTPQAPTSPPPTPTSPPPTPTSPPPTPTSPPPTPTSPPDNLTPEDRQILMSAHLRAMRRAENGD